MSTDGDAIEPAPNPEDYEPGEFLAAERAVTERDAEQAAHPGRWKPFVGRLLLLGFTAVAFYVLFPQLLTVFSAFPRLGRIRPYWYAVMFVLEAGSFVCTWQLQRIAVPSLDWFVSATSQLASNAVSRILPGGAAVGGAWQFRMLTQAGMDPSSAGSALTALSLITTGTVFALPVLAIPTIALGRPVPNELAQAAVYGGVVFAVLVAAGVLLARSDRTILGLGRLISRVLRMLRRPVGDNLPVALVARRDEVLSSLGHRWMEAVLMSAGRSGLDYLALLAALAASGSHPEPTLVLLAYVAASVLGMIPITPGGLGFVEAGLTGTLALAGVAAAPAALATLAYRLVSFWLPLAAGLPAQIAFRVRYKHEGLPH